MKIMRSPALAPAVSLFLIELLVACPAGFAVPGSRFLPSAYDLRDVGGRSYVTPVKSQCGFFEDGQPDLGITVGACTFFANLASFESSLLNQGITSDPVSPPANLSAWHLACHVGYNNPVYEFNNQTMPGTDPPVPISYQQHEDPIANPGGWGGNVEWTIDYLSCGKGPVLDYRAPFPLDDMQAHATLTPPLAGLPIDYMLKEALIFSREDHAEGAGGDEEYRNVIKRAVMGYGTLTALMFTEAGDYPGQTGPSFYDRESNTFYCDSDAKVNQFIHAVAIAGWDDGRPVSGAPGPGAWLIKNSIGTGYGDGGYNWISYYDTVFLKGACSAYAFIADDGRGYAWPRCQTHAGALTRVPEEDEWVYRSDGFNAAGLDSWACARFDAPANGLLKAAGIVTVNRNEEVTIRVYGRWDAGENRPEDLLLSDTVAIAEQGYHVVDLSELVPVREGEELVIAAGFAARSGAAEEPLVYVVDEDQSPVPGATYRASFDPASGWSAWTDYRSLHGGSVFYIQGIMDSAASLAAPASGDYDGDGKSEIAVFRPSDGLWAVRGLGRTYFGAAGDIPVSGDYDGDGVTDIAVFRPVTGLWAVKGVTRAYFGGANDRPVPGDYDGDGTCDPAVFGSSSGGNSGRWGVRGVTRVYFGAPFDEPVPSDFTGDGSVGIAVFRETTGLWAARGVTRCYFGAAGDLPVPGVYRWYGSNQKNTPFRSQAAVFRPSTGLWAVRGCTRCYFGMVLDTPVRGDFDGDSIDETAIFRPGSGLWAVRSLTRAYFGVAGDIPATR
ncbi:MAG: lectin like domain-containing protein [PVC group bacterium]